VIRASARQADMQMTSRPFWIMPHDPALQIDEGRHEHDGVPPHDAGKSAQ
jgi:hypothetical protein